MIYCWMGEEDCLVLRKYAGRIQNGLIVEIGAYIGISTKTLATASPTSKVITIDPFIESEYINQEVRDEFTKNTQGLNVELLNMTSDEAFNSWDRKIDLLHIDGDHSYEQVKRDIRWLKYLKKGGVALFHDYTAHTLPGVKKALKRYKNIKTEAGFGVIIK